MPDAPDGKTALDDIIEELQEEVNGTKEQAYQALLNSELMSTCPSIKLEIYADKKRELKKELAFPHISADLFEQDIEHFVGQNIRLDITRRQDSPMQIFGIGNLSAKILERVTAIHLDKINLLKIPRQLQNLSKLVHFSLSHSKLSSIPTEIGQLTNLQELSLDNNQLSNIPEEIGQLINLLKLHLTYNQLTSLPSEIGKLTKLGHLYLTNNQLSRGIIDEIIELLPKCHISSWD